MLVLSRKASERIQIGENITVEVRRIAGNRVTIAIDAPRDIRILRGELEQAVKEFAEESVAEEAQAPAVEPEELEAPGTPAPESSTSQEQVPEALGPEALDSRVPAEPYIVKHRRINLAPTSDFSDHGMTAYSPSK